MRVTLRAPTAADRAEVTALARRSRALHRGKVSAPATPAAYRAWLARSRRPDVAAFLACRSSDGAIVGAVVLSQIFHGNFRSAYLGFWAGAPHAGKGYLREAVALAVRHAFRELKLHRVEANIQPGNARSIALAESLGFELEGRSPRYLKVAGRWRDHLRYALLADRRRSRPGSRGSAGSP